MKNMDDTPDEGCGSTGEAMHSSTVPLFATGNEFIPIWAALITGAINFIGISIAAGVLWLHWRNQSNPLKQEAFPFTY
jgi:hypothetical protein